LKKIHIHSMKNHFVKIENQIIHFRFSGSGTPIVLFHPSPNSSKMFIPMMEKLAEHSLVIAIDTPGYGESVPLNHDFKTISDYTVLFKKFFEEIGLEKFAIYGSATGSQIGVRYAIENPNQINHLFLDNIAHFTEEERTEILKEYFPDLTPQMDGSHLKKMWSIVSGLFKYFPWYKNTPEFAIDMPSPSPMVLHFIARDFLAAGKNYHIAYQAAFKHERVEYVQALKTPTTIFNWKGSIILPYLERLLEFEIPENVKVTPIPADRTERNEVMLNYIIQKLKNESIGIISNSQPFDNSINNFELKNYPPLTIDEDGNYLQEAWNFLKEKNKNHNAESLQDELKKWINSI